MTEIMMFGILLTVAMVCLTIIILVCDATSTRISMKMAELGYEQVQAYGESCRLWKKVKP